MHMNGGVIKWKSHNHFIQIFTLVHFPIKKHLQHLMVCICAKKIKKLYLNTFVLNSYPEKSPSKMIIKSFLSISNVATSLRSTFIQTRCICELCEHDLNFVHKVLMNPAKAFYKHVFLFVPVTFSKLYSVWYFKLRFFWSKRIRRSK